MIPCYHFGNSTNDIIFSQWISPSKRVNLKPTNNQKEELSDIIMKDPNISLDHIHWRNDNIILPKCKMAEPNKMVPPHRNNGGDCIDAQVRLVTGT